MSDHIPFEVQEEIIKRLPVKSLIQFRSVSKTWKSLIDSPRFITAHSVCPARSQRLLVGYSDLYEFGETYLSIVDDDSFPQQRFAPTVPLSARRLQDSKIFGSCYGLFCLYGYYEESDDDSIQTIVDDSIQTIVVLWNPTIRKSITLPNDPNCDEIVFGFGVCPVTSDPKILMTGLRFREQVKVFMLSSGAWISSIISPPRELANWKGPQAVIGRFIYWLVYDSIVVDNGFEKYNLIISFDLTNNEFRQVYLPISLALKPANDLSIFKRKKSLAIIKYNFNINLQGYTVWKMKHGDPNVFMKLFTITVHNASSSINALIGFRKRGEHLLEVKNDEDRDSEVAALGDYKDYLEHYYYCEIYGLESTFCAHPYRETLLLLNQPDFISYVALDKDEDD